MNREGQASAQTRSDYSASEVELIYSLAKFYLESGHYRKAELVFRGLNVIAPDYVPGILGRGITVFLLENFEQAEVSAGLAVKKLPGSVEAQLFMITVLICQGQFSNAGSMLGEIQDMIDSKQLNHSDLIRYFKLQLSRYNQREVRR